ncbi:MerR family transcriptional regulator [Nocardia caishijiensis]|uniref:DNA-binding transcriptional MerR regulator n=1 Tax=Nocardia caishijiensis TaxID=184756 RepID=A0ABQ6YGL4_9NOCA|nr:MerR family transcriptional regulator [Nocardia caishijiensis]KAF0844943.1 DNA-binding transcriptional MerR regulator [Nocardia caishijiensis]
MRKLRPSDLAQEHGISTQAVRNYERDGCLPPADRTPSGYRVYTDLHAAALRAYLTLVPAFGHVAASRMMRALHDDDLDTALTEVDRAHVRLLEDRETLTSVRRAVDHLGLESPSPTADPAAVYTIGELASHLGLSPATLRAWEAAGILSPMRDSGTGYRQYDSTDRRDARLATILRRGGYRLDHIARVVAQVRAAGSLEALDAALGVWQAELTERSVGMLGAGGVLRRYVAVLGCN